MRCKHVNLKVREMWCVPIVYCFENNVHIFSEEETGDPLDYYIVECLDCGLKRKFTSKNAPKWASVINQVRKGVKDEV